MLQSINRHYVEPIRSFNHPARLFLTMTIIEGVILSGWQLFFNFYMLQSGFNREFLGLVNSLPNAAGMLLGIPLGRISDRIGRKPSLMIGIGFYCLFALAQVTFRQPAVIALSAFMAGIFNMLFIVSQAPLMMKLSNPANRTMLFSLNYGLQTTSGAIGALFAGQLPGLFGTWLNVSEHSASAYQAVLITSVLLGMTCLVPLWLMKEPGSAAPVIEREREPDVEKPAVDREAMPQEPTRKAKGLSPALLALTVKMTAPQVLIGFGAAILIPYMNVFFKDKFDISDSLLGLLFSLSSLLIGIGSLAAPHLSTRLGGKVRAIAVTQFSSLVFLLMIGFSPMLWLSSTAYLIRTMLMNMSSPLYSAFCMERTPEHQQGFVNSILNLAWYIGWAIGPYISGVVQEKFGFTPLFISTAVLYFVAVMLIWAFFNNTERAERSPATAVQSPEFPE